ncbi:hypothetical protein KEM54_000299 [Ascosphaera aggregata]|nr:hypothetical protein KEM54_000299 [Ascosphaera aggregata]
MADRINHLENYIKVVARGYPDYVAELESILDRYHQNVINLLGNNSSLTERVNRNLAGEQVSAIDDDIRQSILEMATTLKTIRRDIDIAPLNVGCEQVQGTYTSDIPESVQQSQNMQCEATTAIPRQNDPVTTFCDASEESRTSRSSPMSATLRFICSNLLGMLRFLWFLTLNCIKYSCRCFPPHDKQIETEGINLPEPQLNNDPGAFPSDGSNLPEPHNGIGHVKEDSATPQDLRGDVEHSGGWQQQSKQVKAYHAAYRRVTVLLGLRNSRAFSQPANKPLALIFGTPANYAPSQTSNVEETASLDELEEAKDGEEPIVQDESISPATITSEPGTFKQPNDNAHDHIPKSVPQALVDDLSQFHGPKRCSMKRKLSFLPEHDMNLSLERPDSSKRLQRIPFEAEPRTAISTAVDAVQGAESADAGSANVTGAVSSALHSQQLTLGHFHQDGTEATSETTAKLCAEDAQPDSGATSLPPVIHTASSPFGEQNTEELAQATNVDTEQNDFAPSTTGTQEAPPGAVKLSCSQNEDGSNQPTVLPGSHECVSGQFHARNNTEAVGSSLPFMPYNPHMPYLDDSEVYDMLSQGVVATNLAGLSEADGTTYAPDSIYSQPGGSGGNGSDLLQAGPQSYYEQNPQGQSDPTYQSEDFQQADTLGMAQDLSHGQGPSGPIYMDNRLRPGNGDDMKMTGEDGIGANSDIYRMSAAFVTEGHVHTDDGNMDFPMVPTRPPQFVGWRTSSGPPSVASDDSEDGPLDPDSRWGNEQILSVPEYGEFGAMDISQQQPEKATAPFDHNRTSRERCDPRRHLSEDGQSWRGIPRDLLKPEHLGDPDTEEGKASTKVVDDLDLHTYVARQRKSDDVSDHNEGERGPGSDVTVASDAISKSLQQLHISPSAVITPEVGKQGESSRDSENPDAENSERGRQEASCQASVAPVAEEQEVSNQDIGKPPSQEETRQDSEEPGDKKHEVSAQDCEKLGADKQDECCQDGVEFNAEKQEQSYQNGGTPEAYETSQETKSDDKAEKDTLTVEGTLTDLAPAASDGPSANGTSEAVAQRSEAQTSLAQDNATILSEQSAPKDGSVIRPNNSKRQKKLEQRQRARERKRKLRAAL